MKVILIKKVNGLGDVDTVVEVSNGYAKNYLFKNNLAIAYDQTSLAHLQNRNNIKLAEQTQLRADAMKLANKLNNLELLFNLKVHQGKSFGTISGKQILTRLHELGYNQIKKNAIKLKEPLGLGNHNVSVNIFNDIYASIKIKVKGIES